MNRDMQFALDAEEANKQIDYAYSIMHDPHISPDQQSSLIQSSMNSIPNPTIQNQIMMAEPLQYQAFAYDNCMQPTPDLPDAMTLTTQLVDLFGNSVPQSDVIELCPIRENANVAAPIIDTTRLQSVLDTTANKNHSFSDIAESSDLFNFFNNNHEASKLQIFPAAEDNRIFASALDAALVGLSATEIEVSSNTKIRKASSHPDFELGASTPKRRRISKDRQPSFRNYQEVQWMEQFEEILKFKKQHGHCLVPHHYQENQVLSRWVKRQRYQYKLKMDGKPSTITEARIKMLEDTGFVWNSHTTTWEKRLKELMQYRAEHGDCDVPMNYPENPALATWIKCQRRQYKLFWSDNKASSMTLDRIETLNELGFIWNVREKETPLSDFQEEQVWIRG